MKQPPANIESLSREALESLVADLCATNTSLEAKLSALQRSHAIVSTCLEESERTRNAYRATIQEISDGNTEGLEPSVYAYAVLNPE